MDFANLKIIGFLFLIIQTFHVNCTATEESTTTPPATQENDSELLIEEKILRVGAERTTLYWPKLTGKRLGLVVNPSSRIYEQHLVDALSKRDLTIQRIFSPEHGFRGTADAGEKVQDGRDPKTGIEVRSLYGRSRKPAQSDLTDLDLIVFDLQDVGVRFYTYIATLHHVMSAAAEAGVPVMVLDRPNPNGHYVDGPVMEAAHTGFLGMHAGVPLVHGMTVGEYARMMNEEGWLDGGRRATLEVIKVDAWNHDQPYSLPVRPSPNLPNDRSIELYPSLGLFEGTTINAGRGTEMQFQVFGSPRFDPQEFPFRYTPAPNFGAKDPKHKGAQVYGRDLRSGDRPNRIELSYLMEAYRQYGSGSDFFKDKSFTAHAGTEQLRQQLEAGTSEAAIRASWQEGLDRFRAIRAKYLLYE